MKYYKYLYVSNSIKNVKKLKINLNLRYGLMGYYIIGFMDSYKELSIMKAAFLKLPFYKKHPPVIVGITKDFDEAVEIIQQITEESLERTGKADIKDYLIKRAKTKDFTVDYA